MLAGLDESLLIDDKVDMVGLGVVISGLVRSAISVELAAAAFFSRRCFRRSTEL